MQRIISILIVMFLVLSSSFAEGEAMKTTAIGTDDTVTDGYYIFDLADGVERRAVFYQNRFGIVISGDLYTPEDLDEDGSYPAIVVGAPYGGVKEQGPGIYANELARRGFVVLAFDPSYNGESGGEPRHISSPEIFSEDFSAGVDFLGRLPYVDREKIGDAGSDCSSGRKHHLPFYLCDHPDHKDCSDRLPEAGGCHHRGSCDRHAYSERGRGVPETEDGRFPERRTLIC